MMGVDSGSGWMDASKLDCVVVVSSECATSANRSVHCVNVFWPRTFVMRAKNDGAKPGVGVFTVDEGAVLPRDRNKNWISMSSSERWVMAFWEARCVVVVKG